MQIKQQALAQQLKNKIAPLYVIIGQDNYLIEDALIAIKTAVKKSNEFDEKILSIQSTEDWITFTEEANSYSLFSETVLLNVFFDKKNSRSIREKNSNSIPQQRKFSMFHYHSST